MQSEDKMTAESKNDKSPAVRMRKMALLPSDNREEEDVDMEANFALLTKNRHAQREEEEDSEEYGSGDEEEKGEEDDEEEVGQGEGSDEEEEQGEISDEEEKDEQGDSSDEEEERGDDEEDDDEEEGGAGGNVHTEDNVKKELSTMSFEDIVKLQQKVGLKVFNSMAHGPAHVAPPSRRGQKRLNKNRPIEVSSKRRVPYLREVVPVKKSVSRDPRFDDLSGEYKPEIFEKTYRFINNIKQTEKESVKKMLVKSRRASKKTELKSLVLRMENQERSRRRQEVQREEELQFKRKQKEQAALGLQPFYLNKGEQNKLQLAEKFEQLKRSGKLDNFLTKKRKRNATKDRKKLPYQNYKHQNPE